MTVTARETIMSRVKSGMTIRRADERGVAEHGWLHSRHTFSFAGYYDPNHMGYRTLRVINDDRVEPGEGFGTHPHSDMEIISYVVDGALEHKDSMGNGSIIRPGDIQRMSAGSGVTHSEFNPLKDEAAHFLQIWIEPDRRGIEPDYEQKTYTVAEKTNILRLVVSPDGRDGSVRINQDVRMHASRLKPGAEVSKTFSPERYVWVQVITGKISLNGETLETGDGAALDTPDRLTFTGIEEAEVLVFDLA